MRIRCACSPTPYERDPRAHSYDACHTIRCGKRLRPDRRVRHGPRRLRAGPGRDDRGDDRPLHSASASTASAATVAKVSANNATNAQHIAAFTAVGIPNPSSWAREVQEYRPYDANDASLTKLRQNLAKYNPAAGVVDKIVATLSLP